jgi:DNA-binding beta-propeller fold protein YncE
MRTFAGFAVIAAASLAIFVACSGYPPVAPNATANRGPAYRPADGSANAAGRIWASSFANDPSGDGFVSYYALHGKNQPPLGRLRGALDGPEGMATDAKGTLYLADTIDGNILVYAPGATTPSKTLRDVKGWVPGEVALGANGTLYATNIHGPLPKHCRSICPPKPGNVAIYAPGSDKPTAIYKTFPATQAYYPIGIGLDAKSDIFVSYETINVSNAQASVIEFAAGSKTPVETGIVLGYAGGIEFDASGNMLVSDLKCPCIDVFAPGSSTPSRQMVKTGTPVTFAFEKNGRYLYVANGANLDLEEYDYATGKLVNKIGGGGFSERMQPTGIAVWPALDAPE